MFAAGATDYSAPTTDVICGVPQGSVLGPILFIIYTADLAPIVAEHGLSLHQYADDSQIYGSCPPAATSTLSTDISVAVDNISSTNRLQLNAVGASAVTTSSLSHLGRRCIR